jgi:carbon-monoxide dehydrogenase medium subunit
VIPGQFEYARPASVGEALRLLREREGEAKVLSGGYSLLPLIKLRLAQPGLLVDIRDLDGMDEVLEVETDAGAELRIGARVTHARLERSPHVAAHYPLIADAAHGIGDRQVRNWGTVGGSLAHADPSSDWPAVFIALDASFACRSLDRERSVRAREWFLGVFQTAIEADELLTEVHVRRAGARSGGAYQKLERRAGDFATVGIAAQVRLGDDGRIAAAGIGVTGVGDAAFAATDAEAALIGAVPGEELFRAAGAAAAGQARPTSDSHGPAEYKRAMTAEMTVRALRLAVDRAKRS